MEVKYAYKRELRSFETSGCLQSDFESVGDRKLLRLESKWQHRCAVPLMSCRYCPDPRSCSIVALADEDGYVYIFDTRLEVFETNKFMKNGFRAHENAVFDVSWLGGSRHLLTASGDKTVALWDISRKDAGAVSVFKGHTATVKVIASAPDSNHLFISGSRDGRICVWDTRTKRSSIGGGLAPMDTISNCHVTPVYSTSSTGRTIILATKSTSARTSLQQQVVTNSVRNRRMSRSAAGSSRPSDCDCSQSVTGLVFRDDYTCISAGSTDNNLKVWDLRKTYSHLKVNPSPVEIFRYPGAHTRHCGYTWLCTDPWRNSLFASCTDNVIYEFSLMNYSSTPVSRLVGAKLKSFYVQIACSPCGRYLVGGSIDNLAYVWKLRQPGRPFCILDGSNQHEVGCVAWGGEYGDEILTCSDDLSFRLWTPNYLDSSIVRSNDQRIDSMVALSRPFPGPVTRSHQQGRTPRKPTTGTPHKANSGTPHKATTGTPLMPTPSSSSRSAGPLSPLNSVSSSAKRRRIQTESNVESPTKDRKSDSLETPKLCKRSLFDGMENIDKTPTASPMTSSADDNAYHYKTPTYKLPNSVFDSAEQQRTKSQQRGQIANKSKPGSEADSETKANKRRRTLLDYYDKRN